MHNRKKASLNLSINAIVIVVLAMTLLGLGLGFIKNQIGQISETTTTVQEQVKAQIIEDLRTGNKKLSFPQTSITLERGQSKDIAIGVRNTKPDGALDFTIEFALTQRQGGGEVSPSDASFFYDAGPHALSVTEAEAYPVRVGAGSSVGTYLAKITIKEGENVYAAKTFFVTIV